MLACASARAVALLSDVHVARMVLHEVDAEFRYAGLA